MRRDLGVLLALVSFALPAVTPTATWAGPRPRRVHRAVIVNPPGPKPPVLVKPGRAVVHPAFRPVIVKPGGLVVVGPPPGVVLPVPTGPVEVIVRGKTETVTIPNWTGELQEGQTYTCSRYISQEGRHEVILYTQDPTADFDVFIRNPLGRVFASGKEIGGEAFGYDVRRPGEFTYEVVAKKGRGLFMLKLD